MAGRSGKVASLVGQALRLRHLRRAVPAGRLVRRQRGAVQAGHLQARAGDAPGEIRRRASALLHDHRQGRYDPDVLAQSGGYA